VSTRSVVQPLKLKTEDDRARLILPSSNGSRLEPSPASRPAIGISPVVLSPVSGRQRSAVGGHQTRCCAGRADTPTSESGAHADRQRTGLSRGELFDLRDPGTIAAEALPSFRRVVAQLAPVTPCYKVGQPLGGTRPSIEHPGVFLTHGRLNTSGALDGDAKEAAPSIILVKRHRELGTLSKGSAAKVGP
jgi:hypothetical protein